MCLTGEADDVSKTAEVPAHMRLGGCAALPRDHSLESNPYTVFTTRLGYHKKLTPKFTLGADFGINNIFDEVYASSVLINAGSFGGEPRYYYPGDARNYYGSLRLGYQL